MNMRMFCEGPEKCKYTNKIIKQCHQTLPEESNFENNVAGYLKDLHTFNLLNIVFYDTIRLKNSSKTSRDSVLRPVASMKIFLFSAFCRNHDG